MTEAKTRFTYQDYLMLPETLNRVELIDGELVREPSPGASHQQIVGNVYTRLRRFVQRRRLGVVFLGPLDVVLGLEGEEEVIQPDLLFVARERMAIVRKLIRGAPDLVIEVLSPSTIRRDREVKRRLYARYGIREFWVVDPESRTLEVLSLSEGEFVSRGVFGEVDLVSSSVLPGLRLRVSDVFEP